MGSSIIVADGGIRCEYCSEAFDPDDVPTTPLSETTLYECPHCARWTEAGAGR